MKRLLSKSIKQMTVFIILGGPLEIEMKIVLQSNRCRQQKFFETVKRSFSVWFFQHLFVKNTLI